MRRVLFLIIIGLGGFTILISLGMWQVQRLSWKQDIIAEITARIQAEPGELPSEPNPETDTYLPVMVEGTLTGERLFVLTSIADTGPGFRVIEAFETEGRRILLDRGFVKDGQQIGLTAGDGTVTGNVHWPHERHSGTPDPDGTLWFARDVDAMSMALETEPTLIIAADNIADPFGFITPLPIDTRDIPNDHLNYAITWFLLAAVWVAMTGAFVWQMRGGNTKEHGT